MPRDCSAGSEPTGIPKGHRRRLTTKARTPSAELAVWGVWRPNISCNLSQPYQAITFSVGRGPVLDVLEALRGGLPYHIFAIGNRADGRTDGALLGGPKSKKASVHRARPTRSERQPISKIIKI